MLIDLGDDFLLADRPGRGRVFFRDREPFEIAPGETIYPGAVYRASRSRERHYFELDHDVGPDNLRALYQLAVPPDLAGASATAVGEESAPLGEGRCADPDTRLAFAFDVAGRDSFHVDYPGTAGFLGRIEHGGKTARKLLLEPTPAGRNQLTIRIGTFVDACHGGPGVLSMSLGELAWKVKVDKERASVRVKLAVPFVVDLTDRRVEGEYRFSGEGPLLYD